MKIGILSAAFLASGAVVAQPADGMYLSFFGGYSYLSNPLDITRNNVIHNNASYRPGFNVGGRMGYQGTPLRYEGELTYLNAALKGYYYNGISATKVTGQTDATAGMVNVYYDFLFPQAPIAPFAGVGIGYAYVSGSFQSESPPVNLYRQSDTGFAYQATAGITYNVNASFGVNLGYRYLATTRLNDFGKALQVQLGSVGVVYHFDAFNYK